MSNKQSLVAMLGVLVLLLSFWEFWRPEIKAIMFGQSSTKESEPEAAEASSVSSSGGVTLA